MHSVKRYVLPIPFNLRGKLLDYNRLYAYPTTPESAEEDQLIILDSGAFSLSQKGKSIDKRHMALLNDYYFYNSNNNTRCVAPDVFMNPIETIENWEHWQAQGYYEVCPVLQSTEKYQVKEMEWQVEYYEQFKCDFWFFSNPSMTGKHAQAQYRTIKKITDLARRSGAKWIHNLGAGWNLKDISDWWNLRCFDSMDSIAYYTSVANKENWTSQNNAIVNAYEANKITVL